MFKGYDVREKFPKLSPVEAAKIGSAFSNFTKAEIIVVGMDARTTSPLLAKAFIAGANAAGSEVVNIGLVTTPMLAYAAQTTGNFGAMISASHNPCEFNGVKFTRPDGTDISAADLKEIEKIYSNPTYTSWDKVGSEKSLDIKESYISKLSSSKLKLKVALDNGNGATCNVARTVFEKMGCDVVEVNARIDGTFPGRGAEPKVNNVSALIDAVKETGAAFGVGFDGDGDRALFVDELGNPIRADYLLLLLGEGKKAVATVNLTSLLEKYMNVKRCKIGRTAITEEFRQNPTLEIAAEWSGHFWFSDTFLFSDGILAAVKLAEFLASKDKPLSELLSKFPSTYVWHTKVDCAEEKKLQVIDALLKKYAGADSTDGVKLSFDDGWVLIRKSNTEPILRVSAEAPSEKRAKARADEYAKIVSKLI